MKLVIVNSTSDSVSYASGAVICAANSTLDVDQKNWYALHKDLTFIKDLRLNNIQVNDGVTTLNYPESEAFVADLLDKQYNNRDIDGSALSRLKVTTSGWHYQLHGIEFATSTLDAYSKKVDGTDYGFVVVKLYDADGVQITDQAVADTSAVKTTMEWEPTHDYEIIGGVLRQQGVPDQDVRVWVIGVPDVPDVAGGSKPFAANINLKYMDSEGGIKVDGRVPKYLSYNPVYHTNKLKLVLTHPAGYKHGLHMVFEIFKA